MPNEEPSTKKVNIMPRPEAWDHICTPLTNNVTEDRPLEVDLNTSFRSGYCYLAMERYAELERDYNVKINVKFIRPVLMRDPGIFYKSTDYRYLYDPMDMGRQAQFLGLPWRGFMNPDICKTGGNIVTPGPREDQDLFYCVYCISALLQTKHPECAMMWARVMFRNMYGGIDNWQDRIPDLLTKLGLDAEAVQKEAKENEDHYLSIIEKTEALNHSSGHGGVPNGVFRGEPFWGQDRFDTLVWRLKQNGLTKRFGNMVQDWTLE